MFNRITLFVLMLIGAKSFAQTALKIDSLPCNNKYFIAVGYGFINSQRITESGGILGPKVDIWGWGTLGGKFEYYISKKMSLGASINYASIKGTIQPISFFSSSSSLPSTDFSASALSSVFRMNYHYINEDGLDTYFGLGGGINFYKKSESLKSYNKTIPAYELSIGLRYTTYNGHFGMYIETGVVKGIVQCGFYEFF